ncbi:hypothetical protein G6F68_016559 [Rhizopus microsporus]|nr:hypothetical protein G6F68_016559 [Rhizopus microsporus]
MRSQVRHALGRAARGQIRRARQDAHPACAQRHRMQRRILQPPDADGQVRAALQQVDVAFVAVELKLHLRIALAVAGHQRRNHMQHERRRRVHPQQPGGLVAAHVHQFFGFLHRRHDPPHLLQVRLALFGQLQPARRAAHQRGLQLLFQPAHRAAGSGNSLPQHVGGGGDGPAVDHGDKDLHFVECGFHN